MTTIAKNTTSTIIPGLRYENALEMIDWLCTALGFEKQAVYMGAGNTVAHSQLTFGNGMIMVGSKDNQSKTAAIMKQPNEIGDAETQAPYLVVSDCEAIYATAKAAGAKIIFELVTMDYGGKAFTCRDPEGHIWNIGEYDPWQQQGS